jgi:Ribbon-helix-helix protein, copG family
MGQTITVRMPKELAAWLEETSARTGLSQGEIIRQQLEHARGGDTRKFMRLAGLVRGARDLSTRKGFSKP